MTKVILNTCGDGYWSNVAKAVTVVDMQLGYVSDELDFGELRVYFDTASWNVNKDGLIYTDRQFERELTQFLAEHGLPAAEYSEQGMQGNNYVSLDIDSKFLAAWAKKFDVTLAALV